jgi:hypothetical protein
VDPTGVYGPGDFVVVGSEPFGEDLGIVVEVLTDQEHQVSKLRSVLV